MAKKNIYLARDFDVATMTISQNICIKRGHIWRGASTSKLANFFYLDKNKFMDIAYFPLVLPFSS